MRGLLVITAAILVVVASSVMAQKNICMPIKVNNSAVNPAEIPQSIIKGMSDRGFGSYNLEFNLCQVGRSITGCKLASFVSIGNSSGCLATFDRPMARPTAMKGGFSIQYTSSTKPNDEAKVMVRCNAGGSPALVSRTKKFASMSPNKRGGVTYMIMVSSSVACGGSGPMPPSGNATCRPVTVMGKKINPANWAPSFLTLDIGFTGQWSWLFSPCNKNPTPPSFAPKCSPNGYAVKYNGDQCANSTFDTMIGFRPVRSSIQIMYGSSVNAKDRAMVNIGCMQGATFLSSPTGMYTMSNNSMGGKTYKFQLGIQDLCGAMPTWTAPPRPPMPPGPNSGSGSSNPYPPVGPSNSGSGGFPPMPSGSGSGGFPPMPSSGSGGGFPPMPSGNSGSGSNGGGMPPMN